MNAQYSDITKKTHEKKNFSRFFFFHRTSKICVTHIGDELRTCVLVHTTHLHIDLEMKLSIKKKNVEFIFTIHAEY